MRLNPDHVQIADTLSFLLDLDLRSGEWRTVHPCIDDLYELTTVVCSENVVQERWRVTGPTKDYAAITTLTRLV